MMNLVDDIVGYMKSLDYEGLHFDEAEAREFLKPVDDLLRVAKWVKAFVDQAENVDWSGISLKLGKGESSLDTAYNILKKILAKLENK